MLISPKTGILNKKKQHPLVHSEFVFREKTTRGHGRHLFHLVTYRVKKRVDNGASTKLSNLKKKVISRCINYQICKKKNGSKILEISGKNA